MSGGYDVPPERKETPVRSALPVLALAALLVAVPAAAAEIVVDVNDTGDYLTIQEGIDAASEGDTVLVYPGTYTGEGNRDLSFGLKNLVLRGRDGAEATIIDASFGVHRCMDFGKTGQDTSCVIDGFTMQGGYQSVQYGDGAGIRLDGTVGSGPGPASPKFVDCIIRDNDNTFGVGGGVYMNTGPSPIFRNVIFEANYAFASGGAVYCTQNCNPVFSGCTFTDNQNPPQDSGGAVHCRHGSSPTFINCWFEGNLAFSGGAVGCYGESSPSLTNCTFIGNTTGGGGEGGGALYCSDASSPTLTNCTFYANRVIGEGEGECIYVDDNSHPVLQRCIFASSGFAPGALSPDEGDGAAGANLGGAARPSRSSSFYCEGGATLDVGQSFSYGNAYSDDMCGTVVCGSGFLTCEDPLFCDPAEGDLTLAATSPCLPAGNAWGVLIGAHGEGCTQPAVENASWGAIKAMYR
ncbi:MAG: hypothetical protein GF400_04555 [Candidatus Eisenbacteria bacterium]|nr:hypothetical protein [Candidatus Eisenbacteria bacterium]